MGITEDMFALRERIGEYAVIRAIWFVQSPRLYHEWSSMFVAILKPEKKFIPIFNILDPKERVPILPDLGVPLSQGVWLLMSDGEYIKVKEQ